MRGMRQKLLEVMAICFATYTLSAGAPEGVPTKLPSKTRLEMGLSAKTMQQNAANPRVQKPKPKAAAQWTKPNGTKANNTAVTKNEPNAQQQKNVRPAIKRGAPKPKKTSAPKLSTTSTVAADINNTKNAVKPTTAPTANSPKSKKPKKHAPTPIDAAGADLQNKTDLGSLKELPPGLSALMESMIYFAAIAIVLGLINIAAYWRLFGLAGRPGWAVLVPFYNGYVHITIAGLPGWALLGYFVPYLGAFFGMYVAFKFAHAYGKNRNYCILFAVFNPIMAPLLGFNKSTQYTGPEGHPGGGGTSPNGGIGGDNRSLALAMLQQGAATQQVASGMQALGQNAPMPQGTNPGQRQGA